MSKDEPKDDGNTVPDIGAEASSNPLEKMAGELESQLKNSQNEFLYLKAEFDNYRKRAIKERSDALRYGGEQAFIDLLGVVDNLERALDTATKPENFESLRAGVKMILDEFRSALRRAGVVEVLAIGQSFDPNIHEALGQELAENIPEGAVCRVLRKPYKFHEKVIRTGQVLVAASSQSTAPQ